MLERDFQAKFIKRLRRTFPGCVIMKTDSSYLQGILDLIVLYQDRWAMLEIKKSPRETFRPNQQYYLNLLDSMSFAAVVFPENEEDVLHALSRAFGVRR